MKLFYDLNECFKILLIPGFGLNNDGINISTH